jgi:hypothetical protein
MIRAEWVILFCATAVQCSRFDLMPVQWSCRPKPLGHLPSQVWHRLRRVHGHAGMVRMAALQVRQGTYRGERSSFITSLTAGSTERLLFVRSSHTSSYPRFWSQEPRKKYEWYDTKPTMNYTGTELRYMPYSTTPPKVKSWQPSNKAWMSSLPRGCVPRSRSSSSDGATVDMCVILHSAILEFSRFSTLRSVTVALPWNPIPWFHCLSWWFQRVN